MLVYAYVGVVGCFCFCDQEDETLAGLNAYDREQERIKMEKLAELAKMPVRPLQMEMSNASIASSSNAGVWGWERGFRAGGKEEAEEWRVSE